MFCLIGSSVYGQTLPDFTIDTTRRTSEYYTADFRMPYGVVYKVWQLDNEFNLTYRIGSDTGNPTKKKVGRWLLSGDTLNFTIDPKALKFNPNYLPTARRYKTFTLKWSGKSKMNSYSWMWKDTPINMEIQVIVLVDLEKLTVNKVSADVVSHIETNFNKAMEKVEYKDEIYEVSQAIKGLIEDYCRTNEFYFTVRTYFNDNLIKHY